MAAKPKLAWTGEAIEALIYEFEKEERLWNKSLPGYDRNMKKDRIRCLERIAKVLDNQFSVQEIFEKIRNLRTYYLKELRQITLNGKTDCGDDVYVSQWKYFSVLDTFLRPDGATRNSTTNSDEYLLDPKEEEELYETDQEKDHSQSTQIAIKQANNKRKKDEYFQESEEDDEQCETDQENDFSDSIPIARKEAKHKRKKVAPIAVRTKTVNGLPSYRQMAIPVTKESSELIFGRYIASELESIDDEMVKTKLKFDMQKLIYVAKTSQQ